MKEREREGVGGQEKRKDRGRDQFETEGQEINREMECKRQLMPK